jgi:hypothetical protein
MSLLNIFVIMDSGTLAADPVQAAPAVCVPTGPVGPVEPTGPIQPTKPTSPAGSDLLELLDILHQALIFGFV